MVGRSIYYFLNSTQRQLLRRLVFLPYDLSLKLVGKQQNLVPDKGLIFTGQGDFTAEGKKFMQFFIEYGQLKPHHKIIEVGSGIGRMAMP